MGVDRRPEQDIVSRRGIPVTLGGVEKSVPRLPIAAARDWKELLTRTLGESWSTIGDKPEWTDIVGTVAGLTDVQVTLICAYDRHAALGGRAWIEENADDEEVYEAFKSIVSAAFPFVRDLAKTPALLAALIGQLQGPSTSSGSASGGSGPSA